MNFFNWKLLWVKRDYVFKILVKQSEYLKVIFLCFPENFWFWHSHSKIERKKSFCVKFWENSIEEKKERKKVFYVICSTCKNKTVLRIFYELNSWFLKRFIGKKIKLFCENGSCWRWSSQRVEVQVNIQKYRKWPT